MDFGDMNGAIAHPLDEDDDTIAVLLAVQCMFKHWAALAILMQFLSGWRPDRYVHRSVRLHRHSLSILDCQQCSLASCLRLQKRADCDWVGELLSDVRCWRSGVF